MIVNLKLLTAVNTEVARLVAMGAVKPADSRKVFTELCRLAQAGATFAAHTERPESALYRQRVKQLEGVALGATERAARAYAQRRNRQISGETVATFAEPPARGHDRLQAVEDKAREYAERRNKQLAAGRK